MSSSLAIGACSRETPIAAKDRCAYPAGDADTEARGLWKQAEEVYWNGRYGESEKGFAAAASAYQALGDGECQALALTSLGRAQRMLGRNEESAAMLEAAVEIARATAARRKEADALKELSDSYRQLDRSAQSLAASQQAVDIYEELGLKIRAARALAGMARAYVETQSFDDARRSIERAADVAGGSLELLDRSYFAATRGMIAQGSGDLDEALLQFGEALEYAIEAEHQRNAANALLRQAEIHALKKNWPESTRTAGEAFELAMNTEWSSGAFEAALRLGDGYREQDDPERAIVAYRTVIEFAEQVGERDLQGRAYFWIANYQTGSDALPLFRRAEALMRAGGNEAGAEQARQRVAQLVAQSKPRYRPPSHADRMRAASEAVMGMQVQCSQMRLSGQTDDSWYQLECM